MSDSSLPLYHEDMFACYPKMIERLKKLVENGTVKTIKECDNIDDLLPSTDGVSKRLPLDGCLYVVFDNLTPLESNDDGSEQEEQIGFSLVYTVKKYNFRPLSGMSVGIVLTRIAKRMNGYLPEDENGKAYTLSPFVQATPLAVRYANGFGYFSRRYVTTVATCADND